VSRGRAGGGSFSNGECREGFFEKLARPPEKVIVSKSSGKRYITIDTGSETPPSRTSNGWGNDNWTSLGQLGSTKIKVDADWGSHIGERSSPDGTRVVIRGKDHTCGTRRKSRENSQFPDEAPGKEVTVKSHLDEENEGIRHSRGRPGNRNYVSNVRQKPGVSHTDRGHIP